MSALSPGDLQQALHQLGQDPEARAAILAALRAYEARQPRPWPCNVREDITGPVVDALFAGEETLTRTLVQGLTLTCGYHSKIVRDFVMSAEETPDHVWEPQTTRLLLHLSRGEVVIGGAYFGDQALLVGQRLKPEGGRVHCFELNPVQADRLAANAAANHLDNVVVNRLGLWRRDDVRLTLDGDDSHAAPREVRPGEDGAPATTIDAYARAQGLKQVGLIMLDIEGGEGPALEGAAEQLAGGPPVVFEVHRHYVDWSDGLAATPIVRNLEDTGYEVYAVRDLQGHEAMSGPVELIPCRRVVLDGPPHGFNMLALRDPAVLQHPLFRVVTDVSPKLLHHRDPALHQPLP